MLTVSVDPAKAADFIIVNDAGTIKVINGRTGLVDHSGSTAATEIQYAIDNLPAGGGRIHIKSGTYSISAGLTIGDDGIIIEGDGKDTVLQFDGSTVSPLFSMTGTVSDLRTFVSFRDFKAYSSSCSGTAFDMEFGAVSTIENVWIENANVGIDLTGTCYYNKIENVRIFPVGTDNIGIAIRNGANENTIIRVRIQPDSNSTGIKIDAHGCGLYSVDVEKTSNVGNHTGIDVGSNANDTLISDVYLERNATNVKLASGVQGVVFVGGFIADGATNIVDNGSVRTVYLGTRIQYQEQTKIGGIQMSGALLPQATDFFIMRDSAFNPNRLSFNIPTGSQYDFLVNGNAAFQLSSTNATLKSTLGFTGNVNLIGKSKSGAPTATEIPAGQFMLYKDSTGGSVKLYYNDAGTLKSVTLS